MIEYIAHRGLSSLYPENTMPAFQAAIDKGFGSLEADVHFTKEGVPVLVHDSDLKRTTDYESKIRDVTLAELAKLDASYKFRRKSQEIKVPTFEEMLKLCAEYKYLKIYPEIKTYRSKEDLNTCISLVKKYSLEERCTFMSFDWEDIYYISSLSERVRIGYLCDTIADLGKLPLEKIKKESSFVNLNHAIICPEALFKVHELGVKVGAWTVNEKEDHDRLVDLRVKTITTDHPLDRFSM